MDKIRIVLADDHAVMREGTRRIMEDYPDLTVVGEADDGEQALEMVKRLQPDVAVLDIRMPKLNGIKVVQQIKGCCPSTKTLILTAYDDDDYILAAMEAGASGYLLKTVEPNELADSIRSVQLGEPVLHPVIAAKVARLWSNRGISSEHVSSTRLTSRELIILELAANGLRNKNIAQKLSISVRTVEGHFTSIFAKLGVSSRIEAVLYGISQNLITIKEKDRA